MMNRERFIEFGDFVESKKQFAVGNFSRNDETSDAQPCHFCDTILFFKIGQVDGAIPTCQVCMSDILFHLYERKHNHRWDITADWGRLFDELVAARKLDQVPRAWEWKVSQ